MSLKFSFTPTKAVSFYAPDSYERFQNSLFPSVQVANNARPTPEMSKKAQRRIRNAVNWLTYLSKKRIVRTKDGKVIRGFQIAFVTLTLPTKQMHSHKEITSKCLNRFLTEARRKWQVSNYVWKAELQSNGNIHYHITWDQFVNWSDIRREWNNAISKLGYTAAYQRQMSGFSFEAYHQARKQQGSTNRQRNQEAFNYGQRTQWQDPNTTDVKNVRDVKNLAAYLSKYLSKPAADSQKTGIIADSLKELTGRIWYCSQSISKLKSAVEEYDTQIARYWRYLNRISRQWYAPNEWLEVVYFRLEKIGSNAREFLREILLSHAINQFYPFPAGLP